MAVCNRSPKREILCFYPIAIGFCYCNPLYSTEHITLWAYKAEWILSVGGPFLSADNDATHVLNIVHCIDLHVNNANPCRIVYLMEDTKVSPRCSAQECGMIDSTQRTTSIENACCLQLHHSNGTHKHRQSKQSEMSWMCAVLPCRPRGLFGCKKSFSAYLCNIVRKWYSAVFLYATFCMISCISTIVCQMLFR